jgi:AraC family transcriptional regulator
MVQYVGMEEGYSLYIDIIEKKELKVVGLSWNGSYSQIKKIPGLFAELQMRFDEICYQAEEPIMIAPFHSRETELTYYVTIPVEKIEFIPEGMVGFTIPAKSYVTATHLGTPSEIDDTYSKMYAWMNEYGYEKDDRALSLEVYDRDFKRLKSAKKQLNFDIYIPVKQYK